MFGAVQSLTAFTAPILFLALVIFGSGAFAQPVPASPGNERPLLRLTGHKGLFFLYGNPSGKVQLSAKHQVLEGHELYVGYTQLMLWEFGSSSTPFSDVNFNPEIFHRYELSDRLRVDVGPFEHVSNGRGGSESRGLNASYVKLRHSVGEIAGTLKLFGIWSVDALMPDLREYTGFWNAEIEASFVDLVIPRWQIYGRVNPGGAWGNRFDRGNAEVGLSMKFDRGTSLPYVYIQYFNGYGESLINYNQSSSAIRIGVRR